jgi:hypothetical protein
VYAVVVLVTYPVMKLHMLGQSGDVWLLVGRFRAGTLVLPDTQKAYPVQVGTWVYVEGREANSNASKVVARGKALR